MEPSERESSLSSRAIRGKLWISRAERADSKASRAASRSPWRTRSGARSRSTSAMSQPSLPRRTRYDGASTRFRNLDFESVLFERVSLQKAEITGTTFQGCGLSSVDLRGASIVGTATDPGDPFDPTFADSILEDVKLDGAHLENVSFRDAHFGKGVTLGYATLKNVDFTGAEGLQNIDWSTVSIEGPVYGLEPVLGTISWRDHPEYLRTFTNDDGVRPWVDGESDYDVDPATNVLTDPATGVRLDRTDQGELRPIDPQTRGVPESPERQRPRLRPERRPQGSPHRPRVPGQHLPRRLRDGPGRVREVMTRT